MIKELPENKFNKRVIEEIEKFCKIHNFEFEEISPFIQWVEWFTRKDEKKRIKDLIK